MGAENTNDVAPVASTPKESTKEMINRMMSDSRMDRAELQELATRYEAEKANIEAETKSQIEALLKSTADSMLNGGGLELNKDNIKILEKFLGSTIPKDIMDRINAGERLTLISKNSKLVVKTLMDAFRGFEGTAGVSAKESANIWKESARTGYVKLDPVKKDAYKALITNVMNNPDLGAAGSYADQALNLALGNTSKEKGIKISNIKDEADRMAVVAVLENIMIPSAQPQNAPANVSEKPEVTTGASSNTEVKPTPATPTAVNSAKTESGAWAKPTDTPTSPEKKTIETKSLEGFLKTYKHNGDNFGTELQKNNEAFWVVKNILGLAPTVNYKEVRTATMALQTKLWLNPDGAFGPKTLAAYKKATPETPIATDAPPKVEAKKTQPTSTEAAPAAVASTASAKPAETPDSAPKGADAPAGTVASSPKPEVATPSASPEKLKPLMERVDAAVVLALQERGLSFTPAGDKIRLVHNPKFAYSLGTEISNVEAFRSNSNFLIDSKTASVTLVPNSAPDSKDLLLKLTNMRADKPIQYFKISRASTGATETPKASVAPPLASSVPAQTPVEAPKASAAPTVQPGGTIVDGPAPAQKSPAPAGTISV